MERIRRKGELPVYQPAITRETAHMLWEMGQWTGRPMTVVIDAVIREAHMVEEMLREERLAEQGFAPTVFVRGPGEEEYRPLLPLAERRSGCQT